MTHDEKLKVIDDLYEATGAGDWKAAEQYLSDDLVIIEADGLPMAGRYEGRTALQDLFVKVMGMMDVVGFERYENTTGGDYVISYLAFQFADKSLANAELCELFKFDGDGKICLIKPFYFDPAPIIAACEAKKANA